MVTTATTVSVPKGTPRIAATIGRMNDRFVFMTISMAPKADFEAVRIGRQAWKTGGLHAVEVPR